MRIPALTFAFVVSTTSFASAAPAREENTGRISYNNRHRPPAARPPREPGWVELSSATPASHGREFIELNADVGKLTQLRLTGVSGRPGIRAVRIEYQDGNHRTFEIEKVLGAGRRPVYVDLRGAREVSQIIVMSDRDSPGEYVLEGNTAATSLATR